MPEDELPPVEEEDSDQSEGTDEEEYDSTETEEETEEEETEEEDDSAFQSLIHENGKILGKYDTEEEFLKAYREETSMRGRQARELGDLRKKVSEYESRSPGEQPSPETPQAAPEWETDPNDGTRYRLAEISPGQYQYVNEFGAVHYTEDQLDEYHNRLVESHTEDGDVDWPKVNREYNRFVASYERDRTRAQFAYETRLVQPHVEERSRVKQEIASEVDWIPGAREKVEAVLSQLDGHIDAAPNRTQFLAPGAYEKSAYMMMAPMIKELLADAKRAYGGEQRGRKPVEILPPPSGGRRPPPGDGGGVRVTKEVAEMAEKLGVDPRKLAKEWANNPRNRNR